MIKYSPVPGSQHPPTGVSAFFKKPIVFYLCLVAIGFGAGYVTRVGSEYWHMYSRIRGAAGHDLTVKHIAKHPFHPISSPTNTEESATTRHLVPTSATLVLEKQMLKPIVHIYPPKPKAACTTCSLGFCDEPNPEIFTDVSTEIQVFLNMQFPCSGVVTQWKYIDYNPTPGKIFYLDVIHYDHKTDQGTWVGSNTVTTTGEAGWVTFNVPKDEQFTIEKDYLVAIHYDDLNADGVIPHVQDATTSGVHLFDGFGILMDNQEMRRMIKMHEPSQVPITAALKQLLIETKHNWRAPALAATVVPLH